MAIIIIIISIIIIIIIITSIIIIIIITIIAVRTQLPRASFTIGNAKFKKKKYITRLDTNNQALQNIK